MRLLNLALLLALLSACQQQTSGGSSSSSSSTSTSSTGTTNGGGFDMGTGTTTTTTTGGGTTTTTTSTPGCAGDSTDGDGKGSIPIINYTLIKSGRGKANPANPLTRGTWSSTELGSDVNTVFVSDTRLRVRFKINSQPGDCPDRVTGQSLLSAYSKIKFLVDVQRDTGGGALQTYQTLTVSPTSVNACSSVYNLQLATTGPTYLRVYDVRSDSACKDGYGGTTCPSEEIIQSGKCWSITLQVVNDSTDNFK